MKNIITNTSSVTIVLIVLSFFFWIILLYDPMHTLAEHSSHMMGHDMVHHDFSGLMVGWTLMVLAMMLPKLISPISHVCEKSLRRKRIPMSVCFVLGYALIWVLIGFLMNSIMVLLSKQNIGSYTPAVVLGIIAVVWQFSPIKQYFLNLGHNHRAIKAFGWKANMDAFVFGCEHGLWCLGSGWALMWLPMLLPKGHNLAMLLVMFIMISEHMEHPQIPRWGIDLRLKLLRILKVQTILVFNPN
ncbi:DUF2182 domain-containing protein [Flagellimonas pacifica]|uniref:Predicted metal-binding integral membrane protein n=1 Tax=Flagellimonas pacifica TaxID=1247520 RepID=A0A285MYC2_9FLAO|nr:DUF2182 domain-containing protein [Allomuricauda parva]SNZ01673.1 Predicted metal-binding integral membrane protein [Allomuricauda parva]